MAAGAAGLGVPVRPAPTDRQGRLCGLIYELVARSAEARAEIRSGRAHDECWHCSSKLSASRGALGRPATQADSCCWAVGAVANVRWIRLLTDLCSNSGCFQRDGAV